jgi:hypothetical protein
MELFIFQHVAAVENGGPAGRKYNFGTTPPVADDSKSLVGAVTNSAAYDSHPLRAV